MLYFTNLVQPFFPPLLKAMCRRVSVTFQLSLLELVIWKITLSVNKGECEFWVGLGLRSHFIAYKEQWSLAVF